MGLGVQGQRPAAECYHVTCREHDAPAVPPGPAPLGTPTPPETPEAAPTWATHRPEGPALGRAPCRPSPATSSSGPGFPVTELRRDRPALAVPCRQAGGPRPESPARQGEKGGRKGPAPPVTSGDRMPAPCPCVRSGFSLLPGPRCRPLAITGNNPISVWAQPDPFCHFPGRQNPLGGFGPSLPPSGFWPGEPRTCQAGLAKIPCCLCKFTLLLLSPRERPGARDRQGLRVGSGRGGPGAM